MRILTPYSVTINQLWLFYHPTICGCAWLPFKWKIIMQFLKKIQKIFKIFFKNVFPKLAKLFRPYSTKVTKFAIFEFYDIEWSFMKLNSLNSTTWHYVSMICGFYDQQFQDCRWPPTVTSANDFTHAGLGRSELSQSFYNCQSQLSDKISVTFIANKNYVLAIQMIHHFTIVWRQGEMFKFGDRFVTFFFVW